MDWKSIVSVAFQPIANIYSGQCIGYEILLRGAERLGISRVEEMFDLVHAEGELLALELEIRAKATAFATQLPQCLERILFFNLDRRIASDWKDIFAATLAGLRPLSAELVSEITSAPGGMERAIELTQQLKRQGSLLAIDRLGGTAEGLQLLHACKPDFVKIDRSLIQGLDASARQRIVVSQLVTMAHTLGLQAIAVGVQNSREWTAFRELGGDLAQGMFVHPPVEGPADIREDLPHLELLSRSLHQRRETDQRWLLQQLDPMPAASVDSPLAKIFERVARSPNASFIPVVDHHGTPLGILLERDMKNYAYSAYGKDLISNKALGRSLRDFLVHCPMADVATPLDQMLATFSTVDDAEGLLITERMVYRGFLSARSLIRAMHEKTLARARDENPLTKLPGNTLINEYLTSCLEESDQVVLAYVDFDNFKPFNDKYGFRLGDRAILLFADLMRKAANHETWFIGHIGGDDFFIGIKQISAEEGMEIVGNLVHRFASDAESFYDAETRERGFIDATDREGNPKSFPLLAASAVLLHLTGGSGGITVDDISSAIAAKKKAAKSDPHKIVLAPLIPNSFR